MPTTRRTTFRAGRRIAVVAVALALPLAACSSGGSDDASSTSPSSTKSETKADATPTKTITIKGFKFSPNPAAVKAGTPVAIRNEDGSTHTFTSTDEAADFDTGDIASGDEKTVTITDPGTYAYQCEIHDRMKGEIVVT